MNRYFILAMIFPSMLTGCMTPAVTATLTTTPPAAEEEIRGGMAPGSKGVVTNNKPTQGGRAAESSSGRDTTTQAAGTAGSADAATSAGTAGADAATSAGGADAAGEADLSSSGPYLDVREAPRQNFSIIPIIAGDQTMADLEFGSDDPVAQWKVAYAGGKAIAISKVRLTYQGEGDPWVAEIAPKDMDWPGLIGAGPVSLDLGLNIGATYMFFEAQPQPGPRITITVELLDEGGSPLKDEFGEAAQLVLPVSVL
jgi:hypothetical protein